MSSSSFIDMAMVGGYTGREHIRHTMTLGGVPVPGQCNDLCLPQVSLI